MTHQRYHQGTKIIILHIYQYHRPSLSFHGLENPSLVTAIVFEAVPLNLIISFSFIVACYLGQLLSRARFRLARWLQEGMQFRF